MLKYEKLNLSPLLEKIAMILQLKYRKLLSTEQT